MTQDATVTTAWWRKYTVGQWLYAAFALSISIAMIWGLTVSRFVPTPLGDEVALAGAVAVAALAAWFGATSYAFSNDNPNSKSLLERAPAFASAPTRIGTLAALGFLFTFTAVETGFLEWWTWVVGTPGERSATISYWSSGGRRSGCAGYYIREAPFLLKPAVCTHGLVGGDEQGKPLRLFGPLSPVGIDVRSFSVGGRGP